MNKTKRRKQCLQAVRIVRSSGELAAIVYPFVHIRTRKPWRGRPDLPPSSRPKPLEF